MGVPGSLVALTAGLFALTFLSLGDAPVWPARDMLAPKRWQQSAMTAAGHGFLVIGSRIS